MSLITPIGSLLCYGPTLFVAARNRLDPSKDPRFEGHLIFPAAVQATAEYKAVAQAMKQAAIDKWGDAKMRDAAFVKRIKWALKDYDKGEPGDKVLKAWTKTAPQIVGPSLQPITVQGDVWSGQQARFDIGVKAFENTGSLSVVAFLNSVQITKRDCPRADGRASADKVFGKVAEEPAGTLGGADADDDMPF